MPLAGDLYYFLHEGGGQARPPVVLLHGVGGDHLSWPADIRRMPGARVLTLDLPGHGKSAGPGLQTVDAYAGFVKTFLDLTGIDRAFLVGHCMGGALAQAIAIAFPERVAGLVLVATGARMPVPSNILENAANPSTFPLALKLIREDSTGPFIPPAVRDAILNRMNAVRQTLLYGDLLACDRFDVSDRLEKVAQRTLILCGTEDRVTPLRYSESLARQIDGAALQTIDGAGHMLPLEQPSRLAKLLKVFLSSL